MKESSFDGKSKCNSKWVLVNMHELQWKLRKEAAKCIRRFSLAHGSGSYSESRNWVVSQVGHRQEFLSKSHKTRRGERK